MSPAKAVPNNYFYDVQTVLGRVKVVSRRRNVTVFNSLTTRKRKREKGSQSLLRDISSRVFLHATFDTCVSFYKL